MTPTRVRELISRAARAAGRRAAPLALLAVAVVAAPAATAWADEVYYATGPGAPLKAEARVKGIENGQLVYVSTQSGTESRRSLASVVKLVVTGETALNAAEEAYAAGKWDEAATQYARAIDTSAKDWVKQRAVLRLVDAGGKSGQFAPAAKAFVELVKTDLATAARMKPAVPNDKPDQAKAAISDVDRALAGTLRPDQRSLLSTFKAELLIASGQGAEASKILNAQPAQAAPPVAGGTGAAPAVAGPADAAGKRIAADRALLTAKQSLAGRNYQKAVVDIESARTSFVDPNQQAEALLVIAQAKEMLAGQDPAKLQEAAIAYMRVVAHFDGKPVQVSVPDALWKVAEIQERLQKTEEAAQIYSQLGQMKNYPKAAQAAQKVAALRK